MSSTCRSARLTRANHQRSVVDAVVIVTPTDTHGTVTKTAAAAGKAIFCEKPLAISLDDALEMKRVVEASGVFFQLGFMRRFDRGYVAAKARLGEGAIGDAVVFKSSSQIRTRRRRTTPTRRRAAA